MREQVQQQFPQLNHKELLKKIAELWKEIKITDKIKYEDLAKEDKMRYEKQMSEILKKGFFIMDDGSKSSDHQLAVKQKREAKPKDVEMTDEGTSKKRKASKSKDTLDVAKGKVGKSAKNKDEVAKPKKSTEKKIAEKPANEKSIKTKASPIKSKSQKSQEKKLAEEKPRAVRSTKGRGQERVDSPVSKMRATSKDSRNPKVKKGNNSSPETLKSKSQPKEKNEKSLKSKRNESPKSTKQ